MATRPVKQKDSQLIAFTRELTKEIVDLKNEVKLVRIRLTGDDSMQTKGLIHEVEDHEKALHELKNRCISLEGKMQLQETVALKYKDTMDQVQPILEKVKEGKGIARVIWTVVSLIVGGAGGTILAHVLHWGTP